VSIWKIEHAFSLNFMGDEENHAPIKIKIGHMELAQASDKSADRRECTI